MGSKKAYICTAFQGRIKGFRDYGRGLAEKGKTHTMRDGAVVARRAHNPKVIGSSPVPATIKVKASQK